MSCLLLKPSLELWILRRRCRDVDGALDMALGKFLRRAYVEDHHMRPFIVSSHHVSQSTSVFAGRPLMTLKSRK